MASEIPASIAARLEGLVGADNTVGRSASQVRMFENCVLKVGPITRENRDALQMMAWLEGKFPVPKILESADRADLNWLLMSRIPGIMACDPALMKDPKFLTGLLADALRLLWSVDITNCPCDQHLEKKLLMAEGFVANGQCDMQDCEPDTYGPKGFRDPEDLLNWLKTNKPQEGNVLSHGDFCLPNVFFQNDQVSGFIDLDHCGVADPYQDIALCYRSLQHNFNGKYGHFPGYDPNMLFEALQIQPDMDLIRYYILLDELF